MEDMTWTRGFLSLTPEWTSDPDTEGIKRAVQENVTSNCSSVTMFAQGGLNKIYDIKRSDEHDKELVIRLSLPVDPHWKTLSEVATLDWLRDKTSLPVPEVVAYEASRSNPAKFEYIVMTKLPGRPLGEMWRTMEYAAKERMVVELASHLAPIFSNQLKGIGNIYPASSVNTPNGPSKRSYSPEVGRIVSMEFFWNRRALQDVNRGPYRSSAEWFAARLQMRENEYNNSIANYAGQDIDSDDDEAEDLEEAQRALPLVKKLQAHISDVFGEEQNWAEAEASMLWHDDLSDWNILVDDESNLTGVIDWECVSALPLWKACDYPKFLLGPDRTEKPDPTGVKPMDDGSPNPLYWEKVDDEERTRLRAVFYRIMKKLEPGWAQIYLASGRKRDFEFALENCDTILVKGLGKDIGVWLDSLSTDSPKTMEEVMVENERLRMERMIEDSNRRAREYRAAREAEAQTST